jgi:glucose-6-phosphate 1-dehydrogenase
LLKKLIIFLIIGLTPITQGVANEAPPCVIVIFGAAGDLTTRKLLPAIYNLAYEGDLCRDTAVIGFARDAYTDTTFRQKMGQAIDQFDTEFWNHFAEKLFYNQADFEQDEGYEKLQKLLAKVDQEFGTKGNRLYYLATPPSYFPLIVKKLSQHQLISNSDSSNWSRVVVEKPFGTDLNSAIQLQEDISNYLDVDQVYSIDHYLAKEGVQNLFSLRFESAFFESLWNREHIDNVQITLGEELGIGTRALFWEETGYLRDIFQNHLMQLLAIVAMEPPSPLDVANIQEEKIRVLNSIRPFPLNEINTDLIRGQYGPGLINGVAVPGYKQENGVSADSTAETFVAAKLFIDNPRWAGVPFYIRGGKRLQKQTTEIVINFKNRKNALFIRIQPNPALFLKMESIEPVLFGSYFKSSSPEAYEKLIFDCIRGDHSLFVQVEEQLAAWRLLTPVLRYWESDENIHQYEAGSWGPPAADQMLQENEHQWQLFEN